MDCGERCYDHKQNRLYFFSIYFKGNNSKNEAERIDYINDNHDEDYLFNPYELMQVTWKVKKSLNLLTNNISENDEDFEEFAKNFENEKITFEPDNLIFKLEKEYPKEIWDSIEEFKEISSDFIFMLNCYCAVSSKKVSKDSLKRYLRGEYDEEFEKAIEDFSSKPIHLTHEEDIIPKKFLWTKDLHDTYNDNEKWNSFLMHDCLKVICGYSYFNEYFFFCHGIPNNWYPRLLYFSYYISSDLKTVYYTISMTSCEGRFRKDYMNLIEATTLKELLCPENIIKVAKWLEEIWEKTSYIYHYNSVIQEENIENFYATNEID